MKFTSVYTNPKKFTTVQQEFYVPHTISGGTIPLTNIAVPVYVHRGYKTGDVTGTDIFMSNHCKTDFSDIQFTDSSGNVLEHYLASHGNYEFITADKRGGEYNAIAPDGSIYAMSGVIGAGVPNSYELYKSIDNGNTWVIVHSFIMVGLFRYFIFINSLGYIFLQITHHIYRSTDGGITFTDVLDLVDVTAIVISSNISENINGDLYIGRYQSAVNLTIYKSTDNGATWAITYTNALYQHSHGIQCDPYTGYIYAGLDGTVFSIIRSTDNGANWTIIYTGDGGNAIGIYCGNGFRLFGAEDLSRDFSIIRTTDDINFSKVLTTSHVISAIKNINGILFAEGSTSERKCIYPSLLMSDDDGLTWTTARILLRDEVLFSGYHLHVSNVGKIAGDVSNSCILGHCFKDIYVETKPSMRLYAGGDHYEAMFYVKIPVLPVTGFNLRVINYNIPISSVNTFVQPVISNLLLHYKLDEGSGTAILDSSGNGKNGVLSIGSGYWNGFDLKRKGVFTPAIKSIGNSIRFQDDGNIVITGSDTDADFQFTTDFTVIAWLYAPFLFSLSIIGNQSGNYGWGLYCDGIANQLILKVGNGSGIDQYASQTTGFTLLLEGGINMIGCIVSGGNVKFHINGKVSPVKALTNPIALNNSLMYVVDKGFGTFPFYGDIDDVRIYTKALTDNEIISIYENNTIKI